MVLSHHPPCQYNRTLRIFNIRVCARCTGIASGLLFALVLYNYFPVPFVAGIIAGFLLPLPAILNFTLNELGITRNNTFKRLVTGTLMGLSIGTAILYLFSDRWLSGLILILWILILEFAVALTLHRAGILEKFVKEYEDAVYKD